MPPSALPPAGTHSQSLIGSPATDVRTEGSAEEEEKEEEEQEEDEAPFGSKMRPNGAVASDDPISAEGDKASWTAAGVAPGPVPGGFERGPTAYHPTRSSAGKVCLSANVF